MSKLKFLYREELLIHRVFRENHSSQKPEACRIYKCHRTDTFRECLRRLLCLPDQALRSFYGTLQQLLRQSLRQPKECFRSRGLKLEFLFVIRY